MASQRRPTRSPRARSQGIRVYTIGLGTQVTSSEMKDPGCSTYNETGELVLKRLANVKDSDTFKTDQPVGIYCHADTADDLGRCYDKVRYAILRLSKQRTSFFVSLFPLCLSAAAKPTVV